MRRLLFVLLLFFSLSTGACALATAGAPARTVAVGVEAGATRSGFALSPADLATESGGPGLTAGVSVRRVVLEDVGLGLRSGLHFAERGAVLTAAGGSELGIALDYLDVPLLVALEPLLRDAAVSPRLYAGGSIGLEVGCGIAARLGSIPERRLPCESDDRATNEFESARLVWGLVGGGGIAVPLGPGQATVDARYRHGMSNLNALDPDPRTVVESRAWSLTAGYRAAFD